MSLKAPVKSSADFELLAEDTYQVVCYAVYDLGTWFHEGLYPGNRREVVLIFEIPSERIDVEDSEGKKQNLPRAISKRYTFSMSTKANLRKEMETWRGKGFSDLQAADFDFNSLLGANAIIQVIHKQSKDGEKTYAQIASITKLLKNMETLKPENMISFYTTEDKTLEFPETMPEWVQNIIKESHEYKFLLNKSGPNGVETPQEEDPDYPGKEDESDCPF